jgi:hypothetical protein
VDDDDERGRPSSCAEALTPEMAETDRSSLEMSETDDASFVTELVRQAISQRAGESRCPLGWLDQQRLDRVLRKYGVRGRARRK